MERGGVRGVVMEREGSDGGDEAGCTMWSKMVRYIQRRSVNGDRG